MSKKNKSFNKNFGNDAPEVYNMDDIGYMVDEAIHDRANRLENERNRLQSMGKDTYLWEVEISYLRREQDMRKTRSQLHMEYMQKFAVDPNAVVASVDENTVADLEETEALN